MAEQEKTQHLELSDPESEGGALPAAAPPEDQVDALISKNAEKLEAVKQHLPDLPEPEPSMRDYVRMAVSIADMQRQAAELDAAKHPKPVEWTAGVDTSALGASLSPHASDLDKAVQKVQQNDVTSVGIGVKLRFDL